MPYCKYVVSILLSTTLTISAIDLNDTQTIIEEASQATKELQADFETIINEPEVIEEERKEVEKETLVTPKEVITVQEIEKDKMATTLVENNQTTINSTVESNITVQKPTLVINNESNETKPITETLDDNKSLIERNTTIESNITTEKPTPIINNESNETKPITETLDDDDEIEGSAEQGLIIFKTHIKEYCGMKGDEFAKHYTQEDWDDIYDDKEFKKVLIEICPKMKNRYQDEWTPHLYQFSLKYASDSDEIPDC